MVTRGAVPDPVRLENATYGWPAHPGVGGLNPAALRARAPDHAVGAAQAAVGDWARRLTAGGNAAPGRFPFREVLEHYQSQGRIYVDERLVAALRILLPLLERRTSVRPAEPVWLLRGWLASSLDQQTGDYESFLGRRLLDSLHRSRAAAAARRDDPAATARAVESSVDVLTVALLADIARIEADALESVPGDRLQRRRTHAALRAVRQSPRVAPLAGVPAPGAIEVAELPGGPDAPDLAARARQAAARVREQLPDLVTQVVEVSALPITRLHDELMFLRCVQVFESLYDQIVRRISRATERLAYGDPPGACRELADAAARLRATPSLYRVLTTMPREVFAVIRGVTDGRSANQSLPYRQVELFCAPRAPGEIPQSGRPATTPPTTLQEAFVALAGRVGDAAVAPVAAGMRELDDAWRAMKRTHWGITLKIIGNVPGTGGTAGAPYLERSADRRLFPLLARPEPTGEGAG